MTTEAPLSGELMSARQTVSYWILWITTRLLSLSLLAFNREARALTDVVLYHNRSLDAWRHGLLPGRDYPSEYPPGAIPFVLMPVEIKHAVPYTIVFACEVLVFDALLFAFLLQRARTSGHREGLWLWLVVVPLMGPLVFARLDMIPTALCALALGLAVRRPAVAGALVGAAALVKLWPLVALAAVVRLPGRVRLLVSASITLVVGTLLAAATGLFPALTSSAEIQAKRGIQIESFAALAPLWHRVVTHDPLRTRLAYYAIEVRDSGADIIAPTLFGISALAVLILVAREVRSGYDGAPASPATLAALCVAVVLVGDKVFSPQYLLWVFGLTAVALSEGSRHARLVVGACSLAALLSHAVFPFLYLELLYDAKPLPLVLLTARDLVLLVIIVLLYRDTPIKRTQAQAAAAPVSRSRAAAGRRTRSQSASGFSR